MSHKTVLLFLLLLCASCVLSTPQLWADDIAASTVTYDPALDDVVDPATLHIGYLDGCPMGCGGDPNIVLLPGSQGTIAQNSGAAGTIVNLLLILAVPDATVNGWSGLTLPISNPDSSGPQWTQVTSGVYQDFVLPATTFQAGSPQIYDFLSLLGPTNSSNSFTNFAAFELDQLGKNVTQFGISVFELPGANLDAKSYITFDLGSNVPEGTILTTYGQVLTPKPNGGKTITVYDNPFTEAGAVIIPDDAPYPAPEPGSLLLLGTGLLGFAGFLKKRIA